MSNFQVKDNHIAAEYDVNGNVITQDEVNERVKSDIKWLKENGTALSPEQVTNLAKVPVLASQLDETNIQDRNAGQPLDLPTYEKKNQGCHPKVLYIENGWNSYKYWMAFTPFGDSNDLQENPSILASNDGVKWEVPNGLVNPIDQAPSYERFMSDTHLVLKDNVMECWYRQVYRDATPIQEIIWRKTSTDGVNWSVAEKLMQVDSPQIKELLSPVIVWDSSINKYRIWVINQNNSNIKGVIKYYESSTGVNWDYVRDIVIENRESSCIIWHIDVIPTKNGYEFLICTTQPKYDLYYGLSADNISIKNWNILIKCGKKGSFDDTQMYRSSLLLINDIYYIYYSAMNANRKWGIGLSIATKPNDITSIKGFTSGYTTQMSMAEEVVKDLPSINVASINKIGASGWLKQESLKLVNKIVGNISHVVLYPMYKRILNEVMHSLLIQDSAGNLVGLQAKAGDFTSGIQSPKVATSATVGSGNLLEPYLLTLRKSGNENATTLSSQGLGELLVSKGATGTVDGTVITQKISFSNTEAQGDISYEKGVSASGRPDSLLIMCEDGNNRKILTVYYCATSERPSDPYNGFGYFDKTLGKMVYRHNYKWVDAMGNVIP